MTSMKWCSLFLVIGSPMVLTSANHVVETNNRRYLRHNHLRSLSEEFQTRIVDGTDSEKGRYPYYVTLMRTSGAMICGGTLIAPDVVLTAAHCFADDLDHVVLGKYFRRNLQNESTEVLQIQSTHIHPYFSYDTKRFDQMLVTLSAPSSYPYLQNINMDGNVPSLTVNITVIGLGATGPNGTHPKVMQEGNLTVVPNNVCAGQGGNDDVGALIRDDHLCLQGPNNQGAQCYGDSGGPQLILGDTPEDDLLVGVVSWGVECGTTGFPSIGSRTSASGFIKEQTCELSLVPPQLLCSMTAEPAEAVEILPTNSPTFLQLPIFTGSVGVQNYTSECTMLVETCTQNSDCCSGQCVQGVCQSS